MAFFNLALVVEIFGWILLVGPVLAMLAACVHVIIGAAKDDDMIRGFVMLGFSLMLLGVVMLALAYLTPLLKRI